MLKVRLGCIWSNRRLFPNSYQFMAWERSFEARVLKIRKKELKYQKLNYTIEVRAMVAISLCEYRSSLFRRFYGTLYGRTSPNCDMVMLMWSKEWLTHSGHAGLILALCGRPQTNSHPCHCVHIRTLELFASRGLLD